MSEKITALEAHPENPRVITQKQREQLKKSIDNFGDLSGIVFNLRNGKLVGGHQRVASMGGLAGAVLHVTQTYQESTGSGTVREGFVEFEGERFAYREVDWDDRTHDAAMISANQQGGEFDDMVLREIVKRLTEEQDEFDKDVLGFDDDQLAALVADSEPDEGDGFSPSSLETSPDGPGLADTQVRIGRYRFHVPREQYMEWMEDIREAGGFDIPGAIAEIRRRLGLPDTTK